MKPLAARLILALALILFSNVSRAGDLVVVVNAEAGIDSLTIDDIMRIFLAKIKTFPNQKSALPVSHPESSPLRLAFDEKILDKNSVQIRAYWANQIFTGRGVPPREIESDEDIKNWIATDPRIIGYIDSDALDPRVKPVFRLPRRD